MTYAVMASLPVNPRADREVSRRASLFDVHVTLSSLTFAVKNALKPILCEVSVSYRDSTYVCVQVEVRERNKQRVIDVLSHGVFFDVYDYRFRLGYPTHIADPEEWVVVSAWPDMHHDAARVKAARARLRLVAYP